MLRSELGKAATFSALVGIAQRFLQIIVSLLIMPAMIGVLGKASFGVWAAAASLTWIAGTLDLGIGATLVTDFSKAFAEDDRERVRGLLTTALWLGGAIAFCELIAVFFLVPRIAPAGTSGAYLIVAVCMVLNVPFSFATSLWAGLQRLYIAWMWEAIHTLLSGLVFCSLVLLTNDVLFYVAVSAGGVLATSLASFAHFLINYPELRPTAALPTLSDLRQLFVRAFPYLLLGVNAILVSYADNTIALSLLGADGAAVMAISQRVCMTAGGLLFAVTQPLWPSFANAAVRRDILWIERYVWIGNVAIISVALAGSALLIIFGGSVIKIWLGGRLVIGQDILWAMAIWVVIPALGRIPDIVLNALGVVWFQVRVAMIFGPLAFGLKIGLGESWGVAGILAATGIAYGLTHLPAYVWWLRGWMRRNRTIHAMTGS